jgi:hypothetical protein
MHWYSPTEVFACLEISQKHVVQYTHKKDEETDNGDEQFDFSPTEGHAETPDPPGKKCLHKDGS